MMFPYFIAILKNPELPITWDNLEIFHVTGSQIHFGTVEDAIALLDNANKWVVDAPYKFQIFTINISNAMEQFPDEFTICKLSN